MTTTIGEWRADPGTNELRRGADIVRIEPKCMDLLMALAERAGEPVSREELLAKVWPGVVVGDEALTQAITRLRRALGDDPRTSSYIETISKRGYRLTAPVRKKGLAAAPPSRPGFRALPWAGAAVVALLLIAGAYTLVLDRNAPTAATSTESAQASWITVAVLPFDSPDAGEAYFARGMSDSLMTELGKLGGLRLIGATGIDPAQAARRARYVVSGSVQRGGESVRVTVRLIDVSTSEQLWSERFERPLGDLFAVQDEITRRLAEALPARITESERQRLAKRHTRSLEAYDLFLRARALFLVRGARENEEARDLYRKAIEIDPKFARAYAGLAMTHAIEHRLRGTTDPARGLERALELAETAKLIDPDLAEVHWALGFVHAQARRHRQAIESLQRAIDLNPSFADAYALMGGVYTYLGEPAKSIPLLRTAMRLEPQAGYLYFLLLGRAYFFENDLEQALINLREAVHRNPSDIEARLYLAAAFLASGDTPAAEWEREEIRSLERGFSLDAWMAAYPLASAPHRQRLKETLARGGL